MTTLVGSEVLKLRTTRAPWALLAASAALSLALAVPPVLNAGKGPVSSIGTVGATLAVLGAIGRGALIVLVLGVVTVTSEFRHQTITTTLLQTPRRAWLLAAKALTAALVGAAFALVNLTIVLVVGMPTGAVHPGLINSDILVRVAGLALAYPLYGLLGVGIGALVIDQAAAVASPLTWLLLLESLFVGSLLPHLVPWTLTGATAALANAGDVPRILPVWAGGALLLGYGLLLTAAGTSRVVHRDIT